MGAAMMGGYKGHRLHTKERVTAPRIRESFSEALVFIWGCVMRTVY